MKRERIIHLGIKSEEDVCTSWEIIFEIFEILYLYEILHLNIWILKVKRMSAHHATLILRYFQLVPARRSNQQIFVGLVLKVQTCRRSKRMPYPRSWDYEALCYIFPQKSSFFIPLPSHNPRIGKFTDILQPCSACANNKISSCYNLQGISERE